MTTFFYRAKSGPKRLVEGEIEAENEREAHQKLTRQGLFPVLVADARAVVRSTKTPLPKGARKARGRVKAGDLALFTFHLSNLISSGLTLARALELLSDQIEHARLAGLCLELHDDIKTGTHFSNALEKFPDVFPPLLMNTVRAGEAGGTLEQVLKNLSETYEREEEMRSKVKQAFIYPAIVLTVAAIMVVVLLIFVVPNLTKMYDDMGQTLPVMTRVVVGISDFIVDYWWLIGLTLLIAVLIVRQSLKQQGGKKFFYNLLLRIPVFGDMSTRSDMASFSRVLGMLLVSGVGILESLRVTESIMEHPLYIEEISRVRGEVTRGISLSSALSQTKIFPKFVMQMIAIGEESGDLDNTLGRIARTYDRDIGRRIKVITTILEPVLILAVGLIVGLIVMAMLLPIFQINLIVS
ncbi:MAG: type II secretion system F family protein [Candidatus Omnitrophica bacterium]|nr:type II secretion system F family protein [Candidatus Omnitrophota bacterium]